MSRNEKSEVAVAASIARLTEARRLLAFTLLPVAEIGYRLGFPDPAYFSRRFRAATGESPSVYRARFR